MFSNGQKGKYRILAFHTKLELVPTHLRIRNFMLIAPEALKLF